MPASPALLDSYDREIERYRAFTARMRELFTELLVESGISVHSVTGRCKERPSFEAKIARAEVSYQTLSDVTDLAGLRIITYFEDEVDNVATLVEKEFDIDRANSVDKRNTLDPDRFGYLSLHYVVMLPPARRQLTEYRRFPDLKLELQIRSILQHAWAEIEHDLGYKSKAAIPAALRRRFSRLAGLLEIADSEFAKIRSDLRRHESVVTAEVATAPDEVALDKPAFTAYVSTSATVARLSKTISEDVERPLTHEVDATADHYVPVLAYLGFTTIGEIDRALREEESRIVAFAVDWLKTGDHESIDVTIPFTYLAYILIAKSRDAANIRRYLDTFHIEVEERRAEIVEKIRNTFAKISAAG